MIVFARAFYSGHDTRTPVITAFDGRVRVIGWRQSAASASRASPSGSPAGAWAEASALGILLWRRTPGIGLGSVVRPLVLFAIGAIIAGVVMLVAVRFTDTLIGATPGKLLLLGQILVVSALGGITYAIYTRLLGIPELSQAISLLRSSLGRRGGGGGGGGIVRPNPS